MTRGNALFGEMRVGQTRAVSAFTLHVLAVPTTTAEAAAAAACSAARPAACMSRSRCSCPSTPRS
eukprot:m.229048 g.229048  ORF g.229048 m.229048 type:complete len:65 (-) comp17650_c0_seq1:1012-1206(-)